MGKNSVTKERNGNLKNITINLPVAYISALYDLVLNGRIASRSEAVRVAVRDYLHIESAFLGNIELDGKEFKKKELLVKKWEKMNLKTIEKARLS